MSEARSYAVPSVLSLLFHVVVALAVSARFIDAEDTSSVQASNRQFINANLIKANPEAKKQQLPQKKQKEVVEKKAKPEAAKIPPVAKAKPEAKPAAKAKPKPSLDPKALSKNAGKESSSKQKRQPPSAKPPEFADIERQRMEDSLQDAVEQEQEEQEEQEEQQIDVVGTGTGEFTRDLPPGEYQVAVTDAEKALAYVQQIQRDIIQNWSRPPSARNGMQAILKVYLVPTGEVVDVTVLEGSGNEAFDRSAVQAVRKTEKFEVPSDPQQFEKNFRQFSVLFKPDDLRY